jgi:hypothetical protein
MKVPFLPLGEINKRQSIEIEAAIKRVLDSGWYIHGKEVAAEPSTALVLPTG